MRRPRHRPAAVTAVILVMLTSGMLNHVFVREWWEACASYYCGPNKRKPV